MAKVVKLSQVPKDVDPNNVVKVYNPLTSDFVHKFNGKPYKIPSGGFLLLPENIARHLARHLAKRIVIHLSEKELQNKLDKIAGTDQKARITIQMKPYPEFEKRVGDTAISLVREADSVEPVKPEDVLNKAKERTNEDKSKELAEVAFIEEEEKEIAKENPPVPTKYTEMKRQDLFKAAKQRGVPFDLKDKNTDIIAKLMEADMTHGQE